MQYYLCRYWICITGGSLLWMIIYYSLLHATGIADSTAIAATIISNGLLFFFCAGLAVILQFYFPRKKKLQFLSALVLMFDLFWMLADKNILLSVIEDTPFRQMLANTLLLRLTGGGLMLGCTALLAVLLINHKDQKETINRSHETEKLAKEAELFNLRQQLQPHFLFNSLNSINALIGQNPQQAREMVYQLSLFLRGTLQKDENKLTTLKDEADHLKLYLDIEKIRFGHRLAIEIMIEEGAGILRLPPLLLQPVMENAIKFALYGTIDAVVIELKALKEDGKLKITVTNPFDKEVSPPTGTGFGLRSVYRRLYLLYARTDLLHTAATGHIFTTTLTIPQHDKGNTD